MPHYQENHISTLLEALNPVRDAAQNWGIDVAQYLETYLEQIAVESVANFREAALLIQNSTVIYVKKVDYLWIITQQLVDNLRRQRYDGQRKNDAQLPEIAGAAVDGAAGEEHDRNARKKRKHKEDNTKYSEINIEISDKLLELEPSSENQQPWKFLPDVYHQFQKRPLSCKKRVVYGVDGEEQEVSQYKCNSVLLPSMTLHHEFKDESAAAYVQPPPPDDGADVLEADVAEADGPAEASPSLPDNIEVDPPSPGEPDLPEDPPPDALLPEPTTNCNETEKPPCDETELAKAARSQKLAAQERRAKLRKAKEELEAQRKTWLFPRITFYSLEKDESAFLEFRGFEDFEDDDLSDDEIGGFRGFPDVDAPKNQKRRSKKVTQKDMVAADLAQHAATNLPLPTVDEIRAAVLAEDDDAYAALESLADSSQVVAADEVTDEALEAAQAESQLEMAKRVNAWHQSIRPKLAEAEERGHFDIHDYGSKILDSFPQTSAKSTMSLSDLLKDVDTRDVPRYFLSTLQLANTMNVSLELPGGPLSMDRLDLTLLSHARHHEDLHEYIAPSREEGTEGPISTSFHFARPRKRN